MSNPTDLTQLRGLVATINLTGNVMLETLHSLMELRAHNMTQGLHQIEYKEFPAQLVEAGRDSACMHALSEGYDWILQFDGDAVFGGDALVQLLNTAYVTHPDSHLVGAYAQLKHPPNLPVIDTGSGTWEPHFPGEGVLPVIRTGGHFILIKTSLLKAMGSPWFKTRQTLPMNQAFRDVDNFARINYDGHNPLVSCPEWIEMLNKTQSEGGQMSSAVGEDSGFCDRAKSIGANLYVDTNVVTGHVTKKTILPKDLKKNLDEQEELLKLSVGLY